MPRCLPAPAGGRTRRLRRRRAGCVCRAAWWALLTYTIWFSGIRRLPVTATALLGLLSPLVAAILGAAIAGEGLTLLQVLGFAVALLAMLAGQLPSPTSRARAAVEGPPSTIR